MKPKDFYSTSMSSMVRCRRCSGKRS